MTDEAIYAVYIGKGAFVNGAPTCDLTKSEWLALPEEVRADALKAKTHELKNKEKEVKHANSADS
jgi:hypothetical protein